MGRVARGLVRLSLIGTLVASASPLAALAAQTTQYTYDALGRVISAIDANGKKVVYTYDSAGNRTRVSNGAEFTEIVPTAWSASSNAGTTGLATSGALRDGDFNSLASIHATNTETNAWVMADLGSVQSVNQIDVAPALASAVGAGPEDLNGTDVEYSVDGTHWATAATINAVTPGATRTVAIGGVSLRYLRIHRAVSGQVAIGDLRLYSAAVANTPLVANPDNITTSGSAVTFDPRANDQDLDGYAISISAVEDPPHGTAVVNSGASITYTPDPGYFGADSFLYTVSDGHNGVASARVSVLVRSSTNHAPVAVNDAFTVSDRVTSAVDGTNTLRPLDNDYDADGDVLTITGKTGPSHGAATIVGSNIITYQPTVNYSGSDSLTYTISDGRGLSSTATITLTLANSPPVAGADSISVSKSGVATFDPRLNDSDPDGDAITVSSVSSAGKGVAVLNGDQTITYTANAGAVGADTFTYVLTDARGATATGQVTVSISPNSAPVALGDNISAGASAVNFDPRSNDTDPDGDPLTIVAVTAPSHGTASITGGGTGISYTLAGGYTGNDSFQYTISDPQGATSTATVAVNSLNVEYFIVGGGGAGSGGGGGGGGVSTGITQINLSTPLSATVGSGGATSGAGGSASGLGSISAAGGAGGGTLPGGSSGQAYAGGAGSSPGGGGGGGAGGPGQASNAAQDGDGNWSGSGGNGGLGIDSAVSGSTTNYAAGGGGRGYYQAGAGWLVGAGSAGGSSAVGGSANPVAAPANRGGGGGGGNSGGAGGSGIVIARYLGAQKATGGTVTQAGGYTIHTFTAVGTLTLSSTNAAPTAVNDSVVTLPNTELVFDPRANDSDPNGDAISVTGVGAASNGKAKVAAGGTRISYTPNTGYTGSDSFSYTIGDGQGLTASATVTVSVQTSGVYDILVVAGGGGGGNYATIYPGGGGGGGGVQHIEAALTSGSYAVTVGAGGAAQVDGGSSSFGSLTTASGGGHGGTGNNANQDNGGSGGGGGGGMAMAYGAGTTGQGFNGGPGAGSSPYRAGGGGGATATGNGGLNNGNGGEGFTSTISGAAAVYGSGGGGGGGGSGGTNAGASGGGNAPANLGGGGGGSGASSNNGGSGGSGIVIVRYYGAQTASGGTVTSAGGYTIHTFTSSGTFVTP